MYETTDDVIGATSYLMGYTVCLLHSPRLVLMATSDCLLMEPFHSIHAADAIGGGGMCGCCLICPTAIYPNIYPNSIRAAVALGQTTMALPSSSCPNGDISKNKQTSGMSLTLSEEHTSSHLASVLLTATMRIAPWC